VLEVRRWALLAPAALVAACTLITGVGALREGPFDDGGAVAEGGSNEGEAGDVACTPTGPESCNDGVDNDCNGATDCADPACTAFACVPLPPSGWSLAEVDLTAQSACPAGSGAATDLLIDPDLGPLTCTCGCALGQPPTCTVGGVGELATGESNCDGGSTGTRLVDGGCDTIVPAGLEAYHVFQPVAATGGACQAAARASAPLTPKGTACSLATVGGGCPAGSACVPVAPAPFATCSLHAGVETCPTGYGEIHAAGTSLADTRGCSGGTCSCESPTAECTNATLAFYSDNACTDLVSSMHVNGTCVPSTGAGTIIDAIRYTATVVDAGCASVGVPPTPSGTATLLGPQTICCP
jgi:hypothetical protein